MNSPSKHQHALTDLAEAQNKLTRALIVEPRNMQEICELAENVRRAERAAIEVERGGRRSKC